MFFSFLILLLSPVAILATPHHLNHALHHRAIAARVAQPPQPSAPQNATFPTHKRRNTQRCRQKPISSSALPSSSSPSPSPSSSPVYHPAPTTYAQPTPTTTQHQVAPVITTSSSPTPVQQQPAPAPTTQAPSSGSGNDPSFLTGTQTGQGTFYASSSNLLYLFIFVKIFNLFFSWFGFLRYYQPGHGPHRCCFSLVI